MEDTSYTLHMKSLRSGPADEGNQPRRVLIVGGAGHLLASALLAQLAAQEVVVVEGPTIAGDFNDRLDSDQQLDRLAIGDSIDVLALSRHEFPPEPPLLVVANHDDYERRGKGKRKRSWESPYANIGKGRKGAHNAHLTRHRQHRGGR